MGGDCLAPGTARISDRKYSVLKQEECGQPHWGRTGKGTGDTMFSDISGSGSVSSGVYQMGPDHKIWNCYLDALIYSCQCKVALVVQTSKYNSKLLQ